MKTLMIKKQNLTYVLSTVIKTLQNELTVVDLKNGQFLVEWLL